MLDNIPSDSGAEKQHYGRLIALLVMEIKWQIIHHRLALTVEVMLTSSEFLLILNAC